MAENAPFDDGPRVVAVIDKKTMKKIEKLAARYGIEPEEVLQELIRMQASEVPEGTTLH